MKVTASRYGMTRAHRVYPGLWSDKLHDAKWSLTRIDALTDEMAAEGIVRARTHDSGWTPPTLIEAVRALRGAA